MKYKHKIIAVVVCFQMISCNTITQISMNAKSNVISEDIDSINFSYKKKIIVVDAFLEENREANQFIFDTGAFYSKIEKQLAEDLKLETAFTKDNGTAQGITRQVEMTSVDKIRLSKTEYQNIAAGKLVYAKNSYSPCLAKHGIIGANLIKLQNWKVDFDNQKLYFSDKVFSNNKATKTNTFQFTSSFLSGIPIVKIAVQNKIIENVIFDLGYNGGLVLPKKYAQFYKDIKSEIYLDKSTSGIFGSNLDTLEVKQLEINLGGVKSKIPVEFSSLNKALLGNDILEHFSVFLNYDNKEITLIPNSTIKVDAPKQFIPGILNDSLWIVDRTTSKYPYKIGDTLKSINGLTPKEVFKSKCDYFMNINNFLKNKDTLKIEKLN